MRLTLKAVAGLLLALLLAVAGGWVWGSAGRWQAEDVLGRSGTRLHLANARGNLLQARVDLFEVNFGNAGRSLEAARADLQAVAQAFEQAGDKEAAAAARQALALAEEAQQLAGRLDQGANTRAAEALRLLPKAP